MLNCRQIATEINYKLAFVNITQRIIGCGTIDLIWQSKLSFIVRDCNWDKAFFTNDVNIKSSNSLGFICELNMQQLSGNYVLLKMI